MQPFPAFRISQQPDGSTVSRIERVTVGELSPGAVVIRCAYSSVNYKDALAATGTGKVVRKFPVIGGVDLAGTVLESDDPRFHRGDIVLATSYDLGVSHDGGYSEVARVPADWIVPMPDGLSPFEAMAIGTAGFTAALAILDMERNGLTPDGGAVIVTGATGGVGCMAIQSLARRGYSVTALTGKADATDFLKSLGAQDVLIRQNVSMGTRPLERAQWAGAVDAVGGDTLAWLTRTMQQNGCIASCGLAGGADLQTTVMPFILRGVKLLGIDSAYCSMAVRRDVWTHLATDLRPRMLDRSTTTIALEQLPEAFDTLLKGRVTGRFVVQL